MNTTRDDFIPQANPKAGYLSHKEEIDSAVRDVLEGGSYILAQEVKSFEREFASYMGISYGVGVASGTDAIEIALRAMEIGSNHLVFTVSHTAVATVSAILRCGATPVLVDIEKKTFTMDPGHLEQSIQWALKDQSSKGHPKAIIPVHLYGHPADMAAISDIASRYGLHVIEDCAHAHGAEIFGKKVGTFGVMAAFSFYPTKNLGALGDGGMVITERQKFQKKLLALRQYGCVERYFSYMTGINSRLDELQAAILRVKLRHLEKDNGRRLDIAKLYRQSLEDTLFQLPDGIGNKVRPVYHLFVIRTQGRDSLRAFLEENGIGTAIHYPVPVHLQPAYREHILITPEGLPDTEKACEEILSLPMYPELGYDQVIRVCDVLHLYEDKIRKRK